MKIITTYEDYIRCRGDHHYYGMITPLNIKTKVLEYIYFFVLKEGN